MSDKVIRRVLLTTDTVGGVWTFCIDLARQLALRGIEITLASLGGIPSAAQVAEARSIPDLCLLSSGFKLEWMEDPWTDVEESGAWLMQLQEEYRPDLVHLNSFGHGHLPWRSPVILTAHSCVLSWWQAVKQEQAPSEWDRYRETVSRSLHAVDMVTCPTYAMASMLQDHYGFKRSRVIYNGSSASRFHRAAKEHFVFTAGRLWDEAKNIRAVASCAPTLPWPVVAAGEAQHSAAHLEGVRMLGRLAPAELPGWYARAAIFALPARYEPFGLAILEAALSGCALVLGDIPSLRELWQDTALFVSPNDYPALGGAIQSLIADCSYREDLSRRSYERALTFTAERAAGLYLDAYETVLAPEGASCVS